MKKKLLSIFLAVAMMIALLPAETFAAPANTEVTSLSGVSFTVEANNDAGLGGDVKVTFTKSGSNYSGTLYLPGSADISKLMLSWNAGVTVEGCTKGETPIPAKGESKTYSVTAGGSTASFTIKTMQGSKGVEGMFLEIDESKGTIAAMNGDSNHETECFGAFTFKGKDYFLSMKGRGNWTWTNCVKKPYNLTIYKDDTYEKKDGVKLISGVKAKKWSILANELDSSYLRNKVGYDIAYELGVGLPSESIDVWMNGEYLGNYLMTPKNDYQVPDDGYMVEIDNRSDVDQFTLPNSPNFTVKEMADNLTVNDVKKSVSKAWDALRQTNSDEYLKYFDLDSWAKVYLLQELYKNLDASVGSIFFTKASMEDGDKLMAGPVWDLDQTLGRTNTTYVNMDRNNENSGSGWYIDGITDYQAPFYQLLGKHESFMKRVYEIYNENKAALEGILANVDTQSTIIADSALMDFYYWDRALSGSAAVTADSKTFGTGKYAVTYRKTDSWEAYISNMKEYITKRLLFFSDNLTVAAPVGIITGATNLAVGDVLNLTANCSADSYQWQQSTDGENWTDIKGATNKTYSAVTTIAMNGTQYRLIAQNMGSIINTTRVAKVATGAKKTLEPVTLVVSLKDHEHNYKGVVTKPTCTEDGYTTYTCSCGDSYVIADKESKLGHNFVNGKCTRCEEKDPAYIPQCVVNKSISLSEGTFTFTLGGQNLGEYTFARSGNNWIIQDKDGKYLGFANNALSNNSFGWTYSNGRFQTSVTTTTSGGGILSWLFGGRNRTTTTTYYLVYTNGRISVSTGTNGSNTSFAQNIENLTHTYGDWTKDNNGQHSKTCAVCGNKVSEPCVYDQEGHKCICGRVDPDLSYVTATFVTGEGASLAPAAQTVISGEGKVTKPAKDPTRTGYIFDAWYEGDNAFDFNSVITENLTITAKWIECNEHNYVNDICTKCGLKDPNAVTLCSGDISVSLAEGKLMLTLGGQNLGEYTFTRSGNNWTIKDKDGKYLGFANNTLSDNAFGWTYSNGCFQTSVTTTSSGNQGFGGILGWLFGGGNRTTTTNYYLVYTNGHIAVSTSTNGANAAFTKHVESDTHSFGNWTSRDGKHEHKCSVCGATEEGNCTYGGDHKCTTCGAYDPATVSVNVNVVLSQRTSGGNQGFGGVFGWLFGGGNRGTTTYTATINVTVTGATASRVEYSTNGGSSWVNGNTVTSNSQIGDFLIRVTDSNGKVHNFKYENGSVEKAEQFRNTMVAGYYLATIIFCKKEQALFQ